MSLLMWEHPAAHVSAYRSFIGTAKAFIVDPAGSFESIDFTLTKGRALMFGMITNTLAIMLSSLVQISLGNLMPIGDGSLSHILNKILWWMLILSPVMAYIGIYVAAACYHLTVKAFNASGGGFDATLRAVCYASVTNIVVWVPFVGGAIASVWAVVLCIIGLKTVHKTTYGRVVLAVILPIALLIVTIFVGIIVLGIAFARWSGKI